MSFLPDLSPHGDPSLGVYCVGWLDGEEGYNKGPVERKFLVSLLQHVKYSCVQTFGRHKCNICKPNGHNVTIQLPGKKVLKLGSSEIRVFGKGDKVYAAPNLIYHYVSDCGYLPPQEFIDAVMSCPLPSSDEYIELLSNKYANDMICPLMEMETGKVLWFPELFKKDTIQP